MIGIYLLFFTTFLFLGEWISRLRIRKDLRIRHCEGDKPEAIHKNKMDCHDLPLASLAMTKKKDSPKDSRANPTNQTHKDSRTNPPNPTIRAKYIFAIFATIFCAMPIVFVLWDYYSLAKLFYSLFGGISVFSALLMARFVANCALRDFDKSTQRFTQQFARFARFTQIFTRFTPKSQSIIAPKHTNPRAFFVILAFSVALFLGHLDLIAVDIFSSSRAIVALFVGVFIIALYFADKITGILALGAFIIAIFVGDSLSDSTQGVIFALFDGYLLIYSFIFSVVWGIRKVLGKV